MTRLHALARRAVSSWLAWRARKRLRTLPGWSEAHEAVKQARASHGRSQPGLRAMQHIITTSLARETGRPNPMERGMR